MTSPLHRIGIAFLLIIIISSAIIFTGMNYLRASLIEIQEHQSAR